MDPILHHYDGSPFAEKARLMLGFKGIPWHSVHTPSILPKPDQIALTGGYRRAPVLQVGADVYCDTRRIAPLLEELAPAPTLFGVEPLSAAAIAHWSDGTLFFLAIMTVMQPEALPHFASSLPKAEAAGFMPDRQKFMQGAMVRFPRPSEGKPDFAHALERLEGQLADGRPYLLGSAACIADFAAYHPLWIVRRNPGAAPVLARHPKLVAWLERMEAIGHGSVTEMPSEEAVRLAATSKPQPIAKPACLDVEGASLGDSVDVSASDYGLEPSRGELVNADYDEIAIRRVDERAGEVVVHFPRTGFRIQAAS